jgi:hypothetical protein
MSAQLISFDSERAAHYMEDVFAGFLKDPADSDYQRGFLAAALAIYRDALGRGVNDDRLTLLDKQVAS